MVTVAFLQNQWGPNPNPDTLKGVAAMSTRAYTCWVSMCLFGGCLTGQRLEKAFGEKSREEIHWTNASRGIGDHASASFKADQEHIIATLDHYEPDVVLAFGKVAADALETVQSSLWCGKKFWLIKSSHPTARILNITTELAIVAEQWKSIKAQMVSK